MTKIALSSAVELSYLKEDERKINTKRIFNAILFLIVSEVIFIIQDLIEIYYK